MKEKQTKVTEYSKETPGRRVSISVSFMPAGLVLVLLLFGSCRGKNSALFSMLDSDDTGIEFRNVLKEDESANVSNYLYFYNGGGVAAGDIDNDGLTDLFFTGNMVPNRLYLNKGNFAFDDITATSGLAEMQGWCTGATMVDINADGLLDIYICRSADIIPERRRNLLYINEGNMTFTERAVEYGLADEGYSTQAVFFDYDLDGDLDMFLINHSLQQYAHGAYENTALRSQQNAAFGSKLYRNDNDHFTDVSKDAGITSNVLSFGLGIGISDVNNDNWPDIYVSNDFNEQDYLFINNRDGTFSEMVKDCFDQVSLFSMGNDFADFNNDGLIDLITLDMLPEDNHLQKMHSGAENFDKFQMLFRQGFYYQYSRNMLHKNNGDGSFSEIGQLSGVSNTDWSWSALFCDFDNDGLKDLFVSNGYAKDYTDMDFMKYQVDQISKERGGGSAQTMEEMLKMMPSLKLPNYIFRNTGTEFENKQRDWGFTHKTVTSGAVYADLDNDGDMDLVMSNINDEAGIYRNNSGQIENPNQYIKIQLEGAGKNLNGIGAKIKVYCENSLYYYENLPVRGFQSSVENRLTIGIGKSKLADSIVIIWPDISIQKLINVAAGTVVKASHVESKAPEEWDLARPLQPLLLSTAIISYQHKENNFNDFTVQPLLPHYLSRNGPAISKGDLNGDGREDIFVGGAKGQKSAIFIQNSDGTFSQSEQVDLGNDSGFEDVASVFFDCDLDGDLDLYVGSGGYEWNADAAELQDRLYLNEGKGSFKRAVGALPAMLTSTGCVIPIDFNNDRVLDLFIGGRVIPGKYPQAPESYFLKNDGSGNFTDVTTSVTTPLQEFGMVTDAVAVDINGDKRDDLIVVGEWMPIRVLINTGSGFSDQSAEYISFPSSGWWNTISAGDFDGDGDPDLIAGNLGRNSQIKASVEEPVSIVFSDFDKNGSIDPVLSYFISGKSYPAVSRDDLTDQLPMLKKRFLTYSSYADVTMDQVFDPTQIKNADTLHAYTLETVFLENRGSQGFVKRTLPAEVQYAPINAIAVDDVNGDGKPDLIMAGNNSWTRIRYGRYNAGHGLVLLGDGKGNFTSVPQWKSGLQIREDIKHIEVLNSNGRTVYLFAANNAGLISYEQAPVNK